MTATKRSWKGASATASVVPTPPIELARKRPAQVGHAVNNPNTAPGGRQPPPALREGGEAQGVEAEHDVETDEYGDQEEEQQRSGEQLHPQVLRREVDDRSAGRCPWSLR